MKRLPRKDRAFLASVVGMAEANPFGFERPALEAGILGKPQTSLPLSPDNLKEREQTGEQINDLLESCLQDCSAAVKTSPGDFDPADLELLRNGVWIWIYHRYRHSLDEHLRSYGPDPAACPKVGGGLFEEFRADLSRFFPNREAFPDIATPGPDGAADLFAFSFQLRRALSGILSRLIGRSPCTVRLRCSVWEAIVTRRLIWSFQYLKERMANFSTLILGESGTGKDLVAETIGTSQFIPYDPKEDRFVLDFREAYRAINLSALTPTLIESELFGHVKGAFTGASGDRQGHFELCSPHGVLFLDEIGDLSAEIQVKLLRVLQSREFYPLGGGKMKKFQGRILSATNREIPALVATGQMREDFLYRIGANVIRVPNLKTRFLEDPEESSQLLAHLLERVLGHVDPSVYSEIAEKIRPLIDSAYSWPGNVRELEQCVRTLLVNSEYVPLIPPREEGTGSGSVAFENLEWTLPELLSIYCSRAVEKWGGYQAAAERLGVDWRTVKKHTENLEGVKEPPSGKGSAT